jgi:predicted AlkP superfamily phosphohydrolase/phosphomutase
MITVRELRRWLFDFEYLSCVINGEVLDNTRSRRVLYEWVDQDTEITYRREGNQFYLNLEL